MTKHIEQFSTTGEYGLKTLVDPKEAATTDIIFVHGVTGNRESTWIEPESKIFWPLTLLPHDVPTSRIFTFGYEANIVHTFDPAAINTLTHHADMLSKSIAKVRENSQTLDRPLIFVAHSIGGLVVEQALLHCRTSSDKALKSVLESTVAIAYLGTPHVGSDLVRWERTLTYLATMCHKTDEHVTHVLVPGAKLLAGIEVDFLTMIDAREHAGKRPVKLMFFYESLGVPGVGLVVPWHSAVLKGYPHVNLHADHVDIARFGSKDSIGYQAIASQLVAWTNEFVKT